MVKHLREGFSTSQAESSESTSFGPLRPTASSYPCRGRFCLWRVSCDLEQATRWLRAPCSFASRTLSKSEQNYAQVEKEALSLVFGVRKYHQYLYGCRFTIFTDHKPLKTILGPKNNIPPLAAARMQRWAFLLSTYVYDIQFKPTGLHGNADGLSRLPLSGTTPVDDSTDPSSFNIMQLDALPVQSSEIQKAAQSEKSSVRSCTLFIMGGLLKFVSL